MPRFIIERELAEMPDEDLEVVARRSVEVADSMDGVVWIKSFISDAEGKMYCEYEAPTLDAILEHAKRVGIPANRVSEVSMEVSSDMFR